MKKNLKGKSYYIFVGCITLSLMIVGATFAYFAASVTDANTVYGSTETVTFGLNVVKVTSADKSFGLIPMYDNRAPFAAENVCVDDLGNPACQIYKITVEANTDTIMFLDGYIVMSPKEGVDVSFTRVYPVYETDENGSLTDIVKNYKTADSFDATMVRNGVRRSEVGTSLNHEQDANCLFIVNDQIGGKELVKDYYVMVWLHDTGENQNHIQGMQLAYTGSVTFITAEGNEIMATFD